MSEQDPIVKILIELQDHFARKQAEHARLEHEYGVAKSAVAEFRGYWPQLEVSTSPELTSKFTKFLAFARAKERLGTMNWPGLVAAGFATSTTSTVTASSWVEVGPAVQKALSQDVLGIFSDSTFEPIREKIARVDSTLAGVLDEIRKQYFRAGSEAARAAMFQCRQLCDHFISALASDEAVRASPCFKENKEPGKELQVHRRERLAYACSRLPTEAARAYLSEQIGDLLERLRDLNVLHQALPQPGAAISF